MKEGQGARADDTGCWSDRQLAARSRGGKTRARQARWFGRDESGQFLSHEDRNASIDEYEAWLHERPGRAGGVARAESCIRDQDGCFRGTVS